MGGCLYIISCVVAYKLQIVIDVSNVTCVTEWINKYTKPNSHKSFGGFCFQDIRYLSYGTEYRFQT